MSNRRLVSYIAQEEPAFITKFKNKIGYVEEIVPDVNSKFSKNEDKVEKLSKKELIKKKMAEYNSDDDEEAKPQVVALNNGDLTEEEAMKLDVKISDIEDEANGRILFKKPKKRTAPNSDAGSITTSSVKRSKVDD
ncbi:hypothetical protein HELRODRAFT_152267, partial [Helobdella robusta]|uniref:DUF4604 domain-containing protein n=1 Tax=Helobdella robusta TaxID=6412 RepID=T1EKQ3_HELRO